MDNGSSREAIGTGIDKNECYLCHGKGHWARHCTSLPSVYLVDNPPKCYSCGGMGHYARFCPSLDPITRRVRGRSLSDPIPVPSEYWYSQPVVPAEYGLESPLLYASLPGPPGSADFPSQEQVIPIVEDLSPIIPLAPTSHLPSDRPSPPNPAPASESSSSQ